MALNVRSSIEVNTNNAEASINNLRRTFERFNNQTAASARGLDNLAHALQAGAIAFNGVKNTISSLSSATNSFIKIADSANLLNARLKLSTDGIKNFENASKALYSIAQNTANSVESVSNLFITLNRTFADLGYSQEKALEVTSTLSTALKAGGADAQGAAGAIKQFSDALAVGVLKGTDFKIMIQNAPALLGYLSDALGVTAGELRAMASEGKLTNDELVKAFANMKDKIAKEFEAIPPTVEGAMTNLQTSIQGVIEKINTDLDITGSVARGIESFSKVLDENQEAIKTASEFIKNCGVGLLADLF